jgi:hypothetical protein
LRAGPPQAALADLKAAMSNKGSKDCKAPKRKSITDHGGKTFITAPVLDRLVKEKMARTPECEGLTALPVIRTSDRSGGCNWRVPGYVGSVARVERCEAALREYLEFLAVQFDLADED